MKKKIFVSILAITMLFASVVFATDELTPSVTADELSNTALVGEDATTGNPDDGIMPISGDIEVGEDYTIPADWARDGLPSVEDMGIIERDVFEGKEADLKINGKQIDGNGFYIAEQLEMSDGIISGDLFLLGKYIDLSNVQIYGNIYVAGENINMLDVHASGNMYIAGNSIMIKTSTFKDVFAASATFTISENSYVLRNLNAVASSITISDTIITRNANLNVNELSISEFTEIQNALNYTSKKEISLPENSLVNTVNYKPSTESDNTGFSIKTAIYSVLVATVNAMFICGFIFLFAKAFVEKQKTENVAKYIGINIAKGLGFAIAIPVVCILLLFPGITIGLSFMIISLYIIIFAVSTSIVSVAISTNITKNMQENKWKFYGITILTALVIAVVEQLPFVGELLAILVGLAGMGLFFTSIIGKKSK